METSPESCMVWAYTAIRQLTRANDFYRTENGMAEGSTDHICTGQKSHPHQTGSTDDFHFIQYPLDNFPEKIHKKKSA
jgi:hypothetical protein